MDSLSVLGYTRGESSKLTTLSTRILAAWGVRSWSTTSQIVMRATANYVCSTHLADLKALTHDVLYETYRTEKLSRTVHADTQYVYVD